MESESTYKISGSRVYGEGKSYNLTNRVTAIQLYEQLNTLTNIKNTSTNIDTKLDQITKQIIQMKLSINTLQAEIEHLQELMK